MRTWNHLPRKSKMKWNSRVRRIYSNIKHINVNFCYPILINAASTTIVARNTYVDADTEDCVT